MTEKIEEQRTQVITYTKTSAAQQILAGLPKYQSIWTYLTDYFFKFFFLLNRINGGVFNLESI